MVVAGVGVWVSFQTLDIIRLFHTETFEHLQDISLASPIGRMVAGRLGSRKGEGGVGEGWGRGKGEGLEVG